MQDSPHDDFGARSDGREHVVNARCLDRRVTQLALAAAKVPVAIPFANKRVNETLEVIASSMPGCRIFVGSATEPIPTPVAFLAHDCPEALQVERHYVIPDGNVELIQAICDSIVKHTLSTVLTELEVDVSLAKRQVEKLVAELLFRLLSRHPSQDEIGYVLSMLR